MMVCTFEMAREADIANILAAFGSVSRRNFIFWEDGDIRTFRNARTAVNTSVGIDIDPGPFVHGETRNHTFHRTDIDTTAVTNA
jgi:hypothetical protein